MKKLHYIFAFIFLLTTPLLAQREASTWYFGDNVGLNFNLGAPAFISDGALDTVEGCSTISDSSGNLLFYTNGKTVWNRNHNTMSNGQGLLGNFSSTQSVAVLPNPSNPDLYYIFTADVAQSYFNGGSGNGFNYSIIDLSLDSGLGRVIEKNTNLIPNSSEKVGSVGAVDGSGSWVVTHSADSFYAYKVDAAGINVVPVISRLGPNITNFNNIRGSIKISPNGKKLAVTHPIYEPEPDGSVYLYNFNDQTGVLSNEKLLGSRRLFYSVEFSSKSTKLYVSGKFVGDLANLENSPGITVYQYDLEAPNIAATEFLVHTYDTSFQGDLSGTLQIGFDKKIYHAIPNDKISVIRTPNLSQVSCDFREFDINLGGRLAKFGLPSYLQSSFESIVNIESLCSNSPTEFILDTNEIIQSISWDFGDPASGINNTSTQFNPIHIFSGVGKYAVTIDVNFLNRPPKTFIEFVDIIEAPVPIDNLMITQCDVDGSDDGITTFNLTESFKTIDLENDDITINYFRTLQDVVNDMNALDESEYRNEFNNQIIYAKVFENVECYSITEITLNVEPFSDLGTYSMIGICDPEDPDVITIDINEVVRELSTDFPNTDITLFRTEEEALLETDELVENLMVPASGTQELYFRIENSNACNAIGKIEFNIGFTPQVEDQSTVFCDGQRNIIDAGGGFSSYLWSTGETTRTIQISQQGTYSVEVADNSNCTNVIYINASLSEEIVIADVIIKDFQAENSVTVLLENYQGNIQYSLDGGQTLSSSNTFTNVRPGLYELLVIRNDCNVKSQTILVGGYPKYFTPNGDGFHDVWQLNRPEFFETAKITIYDRYGKLLRNLNATDGWDGKFEGKLMTPTDYWFSIVLDNKIVYGHFSLNL